MKKNRIISNLLVALAVVTALTSIYIICMAMHAPPIMVGQPVVAVKRVEEMLSATCSGDYEAVSGMLYGNPSLGAQPENRSPADDMLWSAFLESMEFEILGDCYAGDSGVAVDVKIRTLDISATVDGLGNSAQILLNSRMETAENTTELYDKNNHFRQEMIAEILLEAIEQSLVENKTYQEQIITLNLVFEQGEWWIVPDTTLLKVLSGAIAN